MNLKGEGIVDIFWEWCEFLFMVWFVCGGSMSWNVVLLILYCSCYRVFDDKVQKYGYNVQPYDFSLYDETFTVEILSVFVVHRIFRVT